MFAEIIGISLKQKKYVMLCTWNKNSVKFLGNLTQETIISCKFVSNTVQSFLKTFELFYKNCSWNNFLRKSLEQIRYY